eukprot:TRINITY_DN32096_c0_g1_i1.p2 TRINITY_DN32096_c0_g1~~TRINITY_DN32096_c0_g1_i1.p2  ORF type:complete len:120 (-),score=7.25 TRINITY_DN32096_c0_g1_i1:101-460(-)
MSATFPLRMKAIHKAIPLKVILPGILHKVTLRKATLNLHHPHPHIRTIRHRILNPILWRNHRIQPPKRKKSPLRRQRNLTRNRTKKSPISLPILQLGLREGSPEALLHDQAQATISRGS